MDWNAFFNDDIGPLVPYVPSLRQEDVCAIAGKNDVRRLSANESPRPPFPSVVKAMEDVIRNLNEYSDSSCLQVRKALTKRFGVACENIVLGNGSNELMNLVALTCVAPGEEIVCIQPSFGVYDHLAQAFGGVNRRVPVRADGTCDTDALLAAITPKTKIVMVCNPNNPTGTVIPERELDEFFAKVPDDVLVVCNESYIEYADPEATTSALKYFDGVRPLVVLRTFSKIYAMAGVRCGYAIAPKEVVDAIDKVREPYNVNTVAQVGAVAALRDENELERRRLYTKDVREHFCAQLDELGLQYFESQANFVLVRFDDAAGVYHELLKRGIIVRDVLAQNALRITIGSSSDMGAVIRALREILGR